MGDGLDGRPAGSAAQRRRGSRAAPWHAAAPSPRRRRPPAAGARHRPGGRDRPRQYSAPDGISASISSVTFTRDPTRPARCAMTSSPMRPASRPTRVGSSVKALRLRWRTSRSRRTNFRCAVPRDRAGSSPRGRQRVAAPAVRRGPLRPLTAARILPAAAATVAPSPPATAARERDTFRRGRCAASRRRHRCGGHRPDVPNDVA